ncbi:MAG: FecR family protein [Syntrophobacterales bacterium]|nr:FecR family protein [Syntrophobacterales bacterium]
MRCRSAVLVWVGLVLCITASGAWAGTVGVFTQAEGKVELLRQGRPPAKPVRLQDPVEKGDAVRTGPDSRAQIRFVDDSLLTLAPGTLVTIEAFHYADRPGARSAVLQVLRGLVHCVVEKLLQAERPDFLMKTHTAVLGVRGTRWFTLLGARYTAVYGEAGTLEVGSGSPDITRRVFLRGGEMSSVPLKEPPTTPRRFPPAMLEVLKLWLRQGVPAWVLSLDPAQVFWLDPGPPTPGLPQLPDSLFVPPLPKAPPPPEPPGPGPEPPGPGPQPPGPGPDQPGPGPQPPFVGPQQPGAAPQPGGPAF